LVALVGQFAAIMADGWLLAGCLRLLLLLLPAGDGCCCCCCCCCCCRLAEAEA
jgi:hypothetical protein